MRKAKANRRGGKNKSAIYDRCQTPPYAVRPILQFLRPGATIWEPAAGKGNIVRLLRALGFRVIATDILAGRNFFTYRPDEPVDYILTNPPYSDKPGWFERAYELEIPFAFLVPIDTLGATSALRLFAQYGHEQMHLLGPRVNFEMPLKGYGGKGPQFTTLWIGRGITHRPITFLPMERRKEEEVVTDFLPELRPTVIEFEQRPLWEQAA